MRGTLHGVRGEVQSIRYLAEKIAELADDVKLLAGRVEAVSRTAVNRPSIPALAVVAQYASLLVALIALVIAAEH